MVSHYSVRKLSPKKEAVSVPVVEATVTTLETFVRNRFIQLTDLFLIICLAGSAGGSEVSKTITGATCFASFHF